jgi:hypothetical protein
MVKKNKMTQEQNISIGGYPSIHWQKFFTRFPEVDTIAPRGWDNTLVIAYFCKKYKEQYQLDYTFKFNSTAPSKSYEVFQIRKLGSMLSTDAAILKNYIDWFFETKIIAKKRRITSMAFMTDANTVNEYKSKILAMNNNTSIDRSTILPPNYMKVIMEFGQNINTYGELAFVKMCMDNGNATDEKCKEMMVALKADGMDISSLDKVK